MRLSQFSQDLQADVTVQQEIGAVLAACGNTINGSMMPISRTEESTC